MLKQVQYITDEQGKRVGVLLDIKTYQQLTKPQNQDPDILIGLSDIELQVLADSSLSSPFQTRLDDLLSRNADDNLLPEELDELDNLLIKVDQLTVLKTRAKYTLHQQKAVAQAA